ncbi:hypothetical protein QE369_001102 [Agrobacterium larrymoorei]|uniref:Transposase n=1 Tax=Agrobacterium larrymoorei TaxID=160699 RepID=A0AAJ2BDK0_9HYPH|nr:hypothetical protein [Agrobacterium larrymoorei]
MSSKLRQIQFCTPKHILAEAKTNARSSLDFVHDQFTCGRRFRILNVVDDVRRTCLAAIRTRPSLVDVSPEN